jgi:hypothetical protein
MVRLPKFDRRWFAFCAAFSMVSLLAIPTGDASWLIYLAFLGFLAFLVPEKARHTHA